jgi:hypothetical protein
MNDQTAMTSEQNPYPPQSPSICRLRVGHNGITCALRTATVRLYSAMQST